MKQPYEFTFLSSPYLENCITLRVYGSLTRIPQIPFLPKITFALSLNKGNLNDFLPIKAKQPPICFNMVMFNLPRGRNKETINANQMDL